MVTEVGDLEGLNASTGEADAFLESIDPELGQPTNLHLNNFTSESSQNDELEHPELGTAQLAESQRRYGTCSATAGAQRALQNSGEAQSAQLLD